MFAMDDLHSSGAFLSNRTLSVLCRPRGCPGPITSEASRGSSQEHFLLCAQSVVGCSAKPIFFSRAKKECGEHEHLEE